MELMRVHYENHINLSSADPLAVVGWLWAMLIFKHTRFFQFPMFSLNSYLVTVAPLRLQSTEMWEGQQKKVGEVTVSKFESTPRFGNFRSN